MIRAREVTPPGMRTVYIQYTLRAHGASAGSVTPSMSQQVRIDSGARPAMLNELIDSTELGQADCRLPIRHAVIEREFRMPEIPSAVGEREVSKSPGAPGDGLRLGDDHPTFAGRDDLVRVEAKTPRGPKAPDRPAPIQCA